MLKARRRLMLQAERQGQPATVIAQLRRVLSRDALTIGFARRFATYKRANLLLQDLSALEALLIHHHRPVQLILPGSRIRTMDRERPSPRGQAPDPRATVRREDRLHRGLRHQRWSRSRPGCGCVAEQPGKASRGVRHPWSEGRAERRVESVGARRMVGGGLRRAQWFCHRARRHTYFGGCMTHATRARSSTCCETKSCRSITIATAVACRGSGSPASNGRFARSVGDSAQIAW
jgi:hypothetical protein